MNRVLVWEGCENVRDLGGLPAGAGATTRGALVRADSLERLTAHGWAAVLAHGVRTVIDLRNDDELGVDLAARPAALTTVRLPLDGVEDTEFWDEWGRGPVFGTPVYYAPFLERFPERVARVVSAVAAAPPGGVVVHCGMGRDRTGLVAAVLLAVVGVEPEAIAGDYELSTPGVAVLLARLGDTDGAEPVEAYLRRKGTSAREILLELLRGLDVQAYLRDAGVRADELTAVRARLLLRP